MSAFLVSFFIVYGACNCYVFTKAKAALHPSTGAFLLLIFFILAMLACPFIVRISEKAVYLGVATFAAYAGYAWLGIVFLFVSASFVLEVYRLILYAAGLLLKTDLSAASVSARYAFFVPLGLALSIAVYGHFEAKQIRTEHVRIRTSKLPAGFERLRIVQISDVHLGT